MISRALRTRSDRTRKATALMVTGLVALTVAVLATFAPPGAAQGQSVSTSTLPDAGVLRLRTGTENHFRLEPTSGSAVTQTWTSPGCKVQPTQPPGATLVALSSTPHNRSYPGFFGGSLGVGSSSEGNGQPCGRIDPNQTLTLSLVQSAGSALAGRFIDYAELDIEGKFGATYRITGYVGSTEMLSQTYATTGPDSGPDSGDGDNFRIRFPKTGKTVMNKLVISIVGSKGAVSLEGGSDGTTPCDGSDANSAGCADFSLGQSLDGGEGTTDSLFHLVEVDGLLDCGQTVTQGGNGTPSSSLERLPNASGSCTAIPYNLDSSVVNCPPNSLQCIFLQKDLLGQLARFYWTVTWTPEPGQYQESETEFDFGEGFRPLQQCLKDADADGFPELPPTASTTDPADATDPWCVVSTSAALDVDTGLTTVTEKYFGVADPTGRR